MTEKPIGLIAAMPEEIKPLVRRIGSVQKESLAGFPLYRFDSHGKKVLLVESGVGMGRAEQATRLLIEAASPQIILNFGFGGATLPGPAVGDLVVATSLLLFRKGSCSIVPGPDQALAEKLAALLEEKSGGKGFCVHRGTFITTGEIIGKRAIASLLPPVGNPLLEMESAAVARMARDNGIPMVAVRAVSDGADEELDFSINDFVDHTMQIRAHKVLWTLARKPWLIPQLVRLARNSRVAGDNLATAVLTLLDRV